MTWEMMEEMNVKNLEKRAILSTGMKCLEVRNVNQDVKSRRIN